MVRHWHRELPPIPTNNMGISWVDWVMPWVIFFSSAIFMAWLLSQLTINQVSLSSSEEISSPVQLGHPSLDHAWSKAKKQPLNDLEDSPYYP